MAKKRNLAVTSTCIECGVSFHPWTGAEQTQRLCSLRCASTHGSAVLKARVADAPKTPARKRTRTRLRSETAALAPLPEDVLVQAGADWLDAGQRYEQLVARLTASPANTARHGKRLTSGRTLTLAGHGAGLKVERDALVVCEGHTHYPQTSLIHTLYRGIHDVTRIVCLNPSGALSFAAISWCAEQGIALLLLDRSGAVLSAFTPDAESDATLRRAQYLAASTGRDVEIARDLVRRKVEGQRATLLAHPRLPDAEHAASVLADALTWLALPSPPEWLTSINLLRVYEARCAAAYFGAWLGMPLKWVKVDIRRVPPHWLSVRARSSPLSHESAARHAVDPANAILNYAYAVLDGQTRQALSAAGFDLACGFLHADRRGRDALVYDLMELARPAVDDRVLTFLQVTTFHAGDFTRVSDGSCRLHPQLARAVVMACAVPQQRLEEQAGWVRTHLLR
jgi:CRISPR-associated protein Cas1